MKRPALGMVGLAATGQRGGFVQFFGGEQDGGSHDHRAGGVGGDGERAGVDRVGQVDDHEDVGVAQRVEEGLNGATQGMDDAADDFGALGPPLFENIAQAAFGIFRLDQVAGHGTLLCSKKVFIIGKQ